MMYDDDPVALRDFLLTTFREAYTRIVEATERGESREVVMHHLLMGSTGWTKEQEEVWSGFVQAITRAESYAELTPDAKAIVQQALGEVGMRPPGDNDGDHRHYGYRPQ